MQSHGKEKGSVKCFLHVFLFFFLRIILSPILGDHLMTFRGKWLWLVRSRESSDHDPSSSTGFLEMMTISCFSIWNDKEFLLDLLRDARRVALANSNFTNIYDHIHGEWRLQIKCPPRPMDSVILKEGLKEEIIEDIKNFFDSRDYYIQSGIPFRRGYLLRGPPGCGKVRKMGSCYNSF